MFVYHMCVYYMCVSSVFGLLYVCVITAILGINKASQYIKKDHKYAYVNSLMTAADVIKNNTNTINVLTFILRFSQNSEAFASEFQENLNINVNTFILVSY